MIRHFSVLPGAGGNFGYCKPGFGAVAALLAAAALLTGCSGSESPSIVDPPPPTFPVPVSGESRSEFGVAMPAGFGLPIGSMEVFAGTQPTQLDANGRARTNLLTAAAAVVGLSSRSTGNPVGLSLNSGGSNTPDISARSTAEALAFLSPALSTATPSLAGVVLSAIRSSPALAQLTATVESRMRTSPEQAVTGTDSVVLGAVRSVVTDVLRSTPSPRVEEPLRPLPPQDTPTNQGGIQLTAVPQRDGQGRMQVQLENTQPRWVSVVRSTSDDGVTWTTQPTDNGQYGVMLGAGTRAGQSMQPPSATIALTPAPFTRVQTYGVGSSLPTLESDPNSTFLVGAVAAQSLASVAVPALEPVLATNALRTGVRWGSSDPGVLQQWVSIMLPCLQEPANQLMLRNAIAAQSVDGVVAVAYRCAMQTGSQNASVLSGLLSAAGMGGRTSPAAIGKMFGVLGNLTVGLDGVFNTPSVPSVRAVNVFVVPDSTRFLSIVQVSPSSGPTAGGTALTLTGLNFPTSGLTVTLDGVAATQVQRVSATQITAVAPARASGGAVNVEVKAAGYRTATCNNCYTYVAPQPPVITAVTQPFGLTDGNQNVTISGSNFTAGSSVTFGGRPATSVQVVSGTQITARTPSATAIGAVDVIVTPQSGPAATCRNCFIYVKSLITIDPMTGPLNGGTTVNVSDLASPTLIQGVNVGGRAATGLSVTGTNSIRFITPAGTSAGDVPITFQYPVGSITCDGCFTYTAVSTTGRFAGVVRDAATSLAIAGAAVSIRNAGTSTEVDRVTTGTDGTYRSRALPAGSYDLHHSATGYSNSPLFNRTLNTGDNVPDTQLPTVLMVPSTATSGTLNGVVRDATNNATIGSATVEVRQGGGSTTGTPLATTVSSATGTYSFPALPPGTYTVRATKSGFTEGSVIATVVRAAQDAPVLFLSPTGTSFAWRIVLSWGADPRDLDSHLTGPVAGSTNRFHVYYSNRGSLTVSPFAQLDVDVVTGYGPETVTIGQQTSGTYRYYVRRFSGNGSIATSGARVDLYQANTLVRQFYPPQQEGDYWTVFELSGGSITVVNTIESSAPALQMPLLGQSWDGRLRSRDSRGAENPLSLLLGTPPKR